MFLSQSVILYNSVLSLNLGDTFSFSSACDCDCDACSLRCFEGFLLSFILRLLFFAMYLFGLMSVDGSNNEPFFLVDVESKVQGFLSSAHLGGKWLIVNGPKP